MSKSPLEPCLNNPSGKHSHVTITEIICVIATATIVVTVSLPEAFGAKYVRPSNDITTGSWSRHAKIIDGLIGEF